MPYREVKIGLYIDGFGPSNAILLETRGRKPEDSVVTKTIFADDETPGVDLLEPERLPDGFVEKLFREIDAGKTSFLFLWIDERFSDESAGVLNAPARGTFYHVKVNEVYQGLTGAERSEIIRGSADRAFAALYPEQVAKAEEAKQGKKANGKHRILNFFTTEHLPADLRPIGNVFVAVAEALDGMVPDGPERTVALRKLLEAKDAAVRAVKYPGN